MPVVRGPLEMTTSTGFTCDACGKQVGSAETLFMGRVNGRVAHTCSKRCFHIITKRIDDEHPVREAGKAYA